MSRIRRCQKGKPCGATCITRRKVCRKDLVMGLSEDLGTVRDSVSDRGSAEEGTKRVRFPDEASEQYQKDFLDHVERNSTSYAKSTFDHMDLANMVVQASNQLEGEAKENLKRLMDFVRKDDQVLIVSTYDNTGNKKGIARFISLLNKSQPLWAAEKNGMTSFERTLKYMRTLIEELKEKTAQDRQRVREGLTPLHRQRIDRLQSDLKRIGGEIRNAREKLFSRAITYPLGQGNWGFTSHDSRKTVVVDRSTLNPKDRFTPGARVDAKLIAKQMKDNIDFRASKPKLTDEEQSLSHLVVGRLPEGKVNNTYLYAYIHELGHQIHYRSGKEFPPSDSVSLNRGRGSMAINNSGISRYSNHHFNEAFAEAFSVFIFNPSALREHDEPLYNWIRSNFDKAIENVGGELKL